MSKYRLYRVMYDWEGKHCGNEYMGEVIMCKDCKYSHMTSDGLCKYCDKLDAEGGTWYFEGDFFCAYGERREDGEA